MKKQGIDKLMEECEDRLIELIETKMSKREIIEELTKRGVSKELIQRLKKRVA